MKKYTFDVTLSVEVCIEASNEQEARDRLDDVVDVMDLTEDTIDGMNDQSVPARVVSVKNLEVNQARSPWLCEVDGVDCELEGHEPDDEPFETTEAEVWDDASEKA